MDITCLFLALILSLAIAYWFFTRNYNHWQKQNVPYWPNPVPLFGHLIPVITLKEEFGFLVDRIYRKFDASVVGMYYMQRPAVIVRDPELVKSVLITNFTSFHNNMMQLNEKTDPVFARNPFFASDLEGWKISRNRTVNHLAGRKLNRLFVILQEVSTKMIAYTDRKIKENDGTYEIEMKDYFVKYTGEFVANAAFAIEGQSYDDDPNPMSFAKIVKSVFEPTFINGLKIALIIYFPQIANIFRIGFLDTKVDTYLRQNMKIILKQRQQMESPPDDFLQFVRESNGDSDMNSIIADILVFYADVYETSSTTLAWLFLNLSKNKDVQGKLRSHIKSVLESTGGDITYENIKNMNYLDQVLNESLRISPPAGRLQKVCTTETTLTGSDGLNVHLRPGDPVFIPLWGLHHDPKYWKNPDVFDPERFNLENEDGQANRNKCTFLPFGVGPRMCVGMRLAQMIVKLATVTLLMKFSVEPSSKNREPFEMEPSSILTYNKGGMWTKLEKLD